MFLGGETQPEGTLFIIEAPGKKEAFLKTLRELGVKGEVFSTFGHLLASPRSLWPVFIDSAFKELRRDPINPDLCTDMKIAARKAKRVIIATDPDDEGHVIANDVASILKNHPNVLRGLFYGFDASSVKKGMSRLTSVSEDLATPGNVRRVIDRWIGSTFSDPKKGVSVGRILTGALSLVKRQPVELGFLPIDIPASDGGAPFRGNIKITRSNAHLLKSWMLELGKVESLDIDYKEIDTASKPEDHIDTVLAVSRKTGESIKAIEERLQRFYERQHISYPRTDAKAYNHKTVDYAKALAESNHVEIKPDYYPINDQEHAHESIHLLNKSLDLSQAIQYGEDQEILMHIGRNMMLAGQPVVKVAADSSALPFWAKNIEWKRTVSVNNGWTDEYAQSQPGRPVLFTKEQAILKFIHDNKMGRPGTMVSHAVRLATKGLLTDDFKLTEKGQRFLARSPAALFERENHDILEYAGIAPLPEGMDLSDVSVEDRVKIALTETGLLGEAEKRKATIIEQSHARHQRQIREAQQALIDEPVSKAKKDLT